MIQKSELKEYLFISIGALFNAFALKNVLTPAHLVTGGFAGLSTIAYQMFNIPLWMTNVVLNLPLFVITIYTLGWKVIRKTIIASIVLTAGYAFIPELNIQTDGMLMSSIIGGVIDGIGIGVVLRYRGTTGGTDLLAMLIHQKMGHKSISQIMRYIDAAVVLTGLAVFGPTKAFYGIITIVIVTKIADNIVEGIKYAKQVYIISEKSDIIAEEIMTKLDRGVTGIHAKGMYSKQDKQMLFCIVAIKQIAKLKDMVKTIDPSAFLIVSDAREVMGEGFIE